MKDFLPEALNVNKKKNCKIKKSLAPKLFFLIIGTNSSNIPTKRMDGEKLDFLIYQFLSVLSSEGRRQE